MIKYLITIILCISCIGVLYSQTSSVDIQNFYSTYLNSKGLNDPDIVNWVSQNKYLESFFEGAKNYINNINPDDWNKVINDPSLISLYTENEYPILMMAGAEYLYNTYVLI